MGSRNSVLLYHKIFWLHYLRQCLNYSQMPEYSRLHKVTVNIIVNCIRQQ